MEVSGKFGAGGSLTGEPAGGRVYIPESSFSCSIRQVVSQQAFPRLPLCQALMVASIQPEWMKHFRLEGSLLRR